MPSFARKLTALGAAALAFAAVPAAPVLAADDDALAGARQLFILAYAAAEAGAPLSSSADPEALRAYPLYPYLERARLAQALGRAAADGLLPVDDDARAFLEAHAGEPVSGDLRRAWLRSLAARKLWDAFLAEYPASAPDARLRCQWLQARIALGRTGSLEADVAAQWLTPQRLPTECEDAFDWLRTRKGLTTELVEQRVRLLLANGQPDFARTIARPLPAAQAAPLLRWADMLDAPAAALDAVLESPKLARELDGVPLAAGWRKLTRGDPDAALARYGRVRGLVGASSPSAASYTLALALGLAWDRRAAEALELFADLPAAAFDDSARGWQARAALWSGDWREVQRSIAAMSSEERGTPRWRYWSARAAAVLGDESAARELYEGLLPSDNFYAANAAARLGQRAEPHPARLEQDPAQIESLGARPAFVRARELLLCALRGPAFREWESGFNSLTDAERTQAVALAARWQWHDVSVAMATQQRVFYDYALLYPRPYDAEVSAAAGLAALDAPLLYGMIRQESLFRSDAVSQAGAVGLAQLLPATAARTARAWRHPDASAIDLFDPATNIQLGAWHMRELADRFDGQTPIALAAYNAGESAADRWLPQEPLDADIWIENIPYNETREYVERVLWHRIVFGWLETHEPQRVDAMLEPIVPSSRQASADGG